MSAKALPPRGTALLLALLAALLLLRLGGVPLMGPDEPRYARVAVEMARSGDLVTPRLQGEPWLEKPVLYYWLAALGHVLLGENEVAARLPSVVSALVFVGTTALVGARLFGAAAGLHAGFVLGTSLLTFGYGRAASMDMLLSAAVTLATGLLGLRFLGVAGPLAIVAAYAVMGVGVLAKGPLGALLPLLVAVGFCAVTRDAGRLRALASPLGWLAFLLVAAPWHLLILRDQGFAFIEVFYLDHNLQRFTSTIHRHPGPFYYYLPVLIAGLFPWSGLIIPALASVRPRRAPAELFAFLWLLLPLLFFSAAGSKLPGYILPCLAPLALLMGRAAARLVEDDPAVRSWNRAAALTGLVLGALVAGLPAWLRAQGEPRWTQALPLAIWSVVVTFTIARRIDVNPAATLALWRVGAAGLLLLATAAAPEIVARQQSGRALFLPAQGREVLVFGAWRTVWMSGYFYNDGRVRVVDWPELMSAAAQRPVLVACGPAERRRLEQAKGLRTLLLASGPRDNVLLKLEPQEH
jgi:4-amino-4-deoxy-L-arabinose transferase-like glycosyltransferase